MNNKSIDFSKLKILHYCMGSPYLDDGGYTETVMAKCHRQICKDATLLTTNKKLMKNGEVIRCDASVYRDKSDVKIIRLDVFSKCVPRNTCAFDGLVLYKEAYNVLLDEKPDVIVVDGVSAFKNFPIAKYKRKVNKNCLVVCHSHVTEENAGRSKKRIKRKVWNCAIKLQNIYMCRYYKRVYGIIQGAVDYMIDNLGIPKDKAGLLDLGYDSQLVDFERRSLIRDEVRSRYGINKEDFLVVHGGKLGDGKKTKELVECIKNLPEDVSVIIFGDFGTHNYGGVVDSSYEKEVKELAKRDSHLIIFTGSLEQNDIYSLFQAADVVAFPGAPSCMRQEAVGCGTPIVMSVNPGDERINVNLNNNSIYLHGDLDIEKLTQAIKWIYSDRSVADRALQLAKGDYRQYSYMNQAERIIAENI